LLHVYNFQYQKVERHITLHYTISWQHPASVLRVWPLVIGACWCSFFKIMCTPYAIGEKGCIFQFLKTSLKLCHSDVAYVVGVFVLSTDSPLT